MALQSGHALVARALKDAGVDTIFFLLGGPCVPTTTACEREEIRLIDVRHEQAAAMMAHAYSRVTGRPGVCLAASGPAVANLATGVYNAYIDACPVVALGGASPLFQQGKGAFQELDQVSLMKPITKWAERVTDARQIPELLSTAFRHATSGQPGPVYLDLPADVLYRREEKGQVCFPPPSQYHSRSRPLADPQDVSRAVELLREAERPIVLSGTGVWWSQAFEQLQEFVELTGVPFYTTPQGRGVIPEDHPLALSDARGVAFREADFILVVGTRFNFMLNFGNPPRFNAQAKIVRIDIEPAEMGRNRAVDVALVGDARAVLNQLMDACRKYPDKKEWRSWIQTLKEACGEWRRKIEPLLNSDEVPIHPLRLFREVREWLPRDTILSVDGNETLLFARQAVPTYCPGHRLNVGPSGCIGVGVPFGIGAKAARPDKPVVVLSGDGGFGMNGMELDTAVRHNLPVVVVINNNGGWAADRGPGRIPGRDLGFTRYDRIVEALGGHGELVQRPEEIRPALERALQAGKPACVNVITDPYAAAETVADYSGYGDDE